uniref:Mitochondrial ribosomal protein L38 n=1 Tax=Neogobius melanostomus TaxID=47308 RepID=A0A8C6SI57_9GOBI
MAVCRVCSAAWKTVAENGLIKARSLATSASLYVRRAPAPGPLPNQDIDVTDLESLEKYRSYIRYVREAQEADNKPAWWCTYRKHVQQADPHHGEELVDIGLPYDQPNRTRQVRERKQHMKENKRNTELERAARLRTLKVPLERVQQTWVQTSAPFHIRRLAEHYGVYRDLFPNAYFLPQVPLKVCHGPDGSVHYGNRLTPTEVRTAMFYPIALPYLRMVLSRRRRQPHKSASRQRRARCGRCCSHVQGEHPSRSGGRGAGAVSLPAPLPRQRHRLPPLRLCPLQTGRTHRLPGGGTTVAMSFPGGAHVQDSGLLQTAPGAHDTHRAGLLPERVGRLGHPDLPPHAQHEGASIRVHPSPGVPPSPGQVPAQTAPALPGPLQRRKTTHLRDILRHV